MVPFIYYYCIVTYKSLHLKQHFVDFLSFLCLTFFVINQLFLNVYCNLCRAYQLKQALSAVYCNLCSVYHLIQPYQLCIVTCVASII